MKKNPTLEIFKAETDAELVLPIADEGIKAGFPSLAQDFLDLAIDFKQGTDKTSCQYILWKGKRR